MTILKLILVEPEHDLYQLASVCKLQSDREYCMLVLHMFLHIISSLYENAKPLHGFSLLCRHNSVKSARFRWKAVFPSSVFT